MGSAVVHRVDSAGCGYGQAVSSWEGRELLNRIRRRKFRDQMSDHQLCGVTICGPVGLGSVRHIRGLTQLDTLRRGLRGCGAEHCGCVNGSNTGQGGAAASAVSRDCCTAGLVVT